MAVHLHNISKSFGSHLAVDALSLHVPRGSIYGFIGPNGSGKTTTLRMILNILHPDTGGLEVLGQSGTRAANDRIGYLPEERGLYKKMTVRRVLLYYASLKNMDPAPARASVDGWLERMGLEAWATKKVEALSKGMAQKIQFISAVVAEPELCILDEPFSGLDPVNLDILRAEIVRLKSSGTTVIFSTHDMGMAEKMCDYIFMIHRGKKVLDGTLPSIQAQYGEDTIRLRFHGPSSILKDLPGVAGLRDMGRYQELQFRGDSQWLLQQVTSKARVELFEVSRPSLEDIFVRIANVP